MKGKIALWSVVIFVALAFSKIMPAAPNPDIGSGYPGYKLYRKFDDINRFVLMIDEPWTIGPGIDADFFKRSQQILYDQNFYFKDRQPSTDELKYLRQNGLIYGGVVKNLFPFASNMAFCYDEDPEEYAKHSSDLMYVPPEKKNLYILENEKITIIPDGLEQAAKKRYGLLDDEVFLGWIEGRIFYAKKRGDSNRDVNKIYFKDGKSSTVFSIDLPKGTERAYGALHGLKKDAGVYILTKSRGLVVTSPMTFLFYEFNLSQARKEKD